jgi:hypothetical protein
MSEWEILSSLYSRYGLAPSKKEFGRLEKRLIGKGYASLDSSLGEERLRITSDGKSLLHRLENEHKALVSSIVRS